MSGLPTLTLGELSLIGVILEAFFYGIYSGIFSMYLRYQFSTKCADKRANIIFYCHCTLYVLSTALAASDVASKLINNATGDRLYISANIISIFCDVIAQSILIYRCWIVWNRSIRVIIIPSILAFTYLALDVALIPFELTEKFSATAGLTVSMAVNTLTTGLIVFKIFKVYWQVKPLYDQPLGRTGGSKLRPLIFIIIESGLALFSIQLAWLVTDSVATQAAAIAVVPAFYIRRILIGITPTIIQVRVVMGLSFHNEESLVEVTSSLRFGSVNDDQNEISIDQQENRDDDIGMLKRNEIDEQESSGEKNIDVRQSNDFGIVEVQREEHICSP